MSEAKQKSVKPEFQSWGQYPRYEADMIDLNWSSDFPLKQKPGTSLLPVGLGRSYGDSCLLDHGTLLNATGMTRVHEFNAETGLLRCESGMSLSEILDFAVPQGWFLPVTPGTKFVTVGGAIANDVHGKNHHVAGTFGCHVPRFELIRSDGSRHLCSATENSELYHATIGGLGLTGLISWAEVQLRPIVSRQIYYTGIKFRGIDEFLEISNASKNIEYTVAWIDCVSEGKNFARGIFMQGEHAKTPGKLFRSKEPKLSVPFEMPSFLLNRYSVKAFNTLYYNKQLPRVKRTHLDYEPFFYPLDSVLHWNRIYGHDGLMQFQCVLPYEEGTGGITEILHTITASGLASFLAVIKVFGDVKSPGMLSFPRPGITLALDFPVRRDVSFALLDRLGEITLEHGGCMYPAKDARMKPAEFQSFYPQWTDFARYIDPAFDSAFWKRVTAHV